MKLTDTQTQLILIPTSFSLSLQADLSPVRAQGSTWFTAKSPNANAVSVTFMQENVYAQQAAVGLCQRWCKDNASLYFSYEEMGIKDWIVCIGSVPFTFQFDTPVNPCQIDLKPITDWYYDSQAQRVTESDIYSVFGGGIVTKNTTALESAAQVAQWLDAHEQFHGVKIEYLKNGRVSIQYSNGQTYNNVEPTASLLQSLLNYSSAHENLEEGGFGKQQKTTSASAAQPSSSSSKTKSNSARSAIRPINPRDIW